MNQSTTLRFREGSSDKTYTARIQPQGTGFVVNVEYGRYGGSQKAETKTPEPVALEVAEKVCQKLLNGKRAKGYSDTEGGQAYAGTELAGRDTGVRVQLLNSIDSEAELETFLCDSSWGMQEKLDGQRRTIAIEGDQITGANRKGLVVPLAGEVVEVIRDRFKVTGKTVLDGEDFGTTFAPFDLLMYEGRDIRSMPYQERLALLEMLMVDAMECPRPHTYRVTEQKRKVLQTLREQGFEGVVFKKMSSEYASGRPNSGGDQRKFKFTASATCRVCEQNIGKRSVGLELLDVESSKWVFVGNVTIMPNFSVPVVGSIVEVKYLNVLKGGSLYQPIYAGLRSDLDASDCVVSQLKYKQEAVHSQAA